MAPRFASDQRDPTTVEVRSSPARRGRADRQHRPARPRPSRWCGQVVARGVRADRFQTPQPARPPLVVAKSTDSRSAALTSRRTDDRLPTALVKHTEVSGRSSLIVPVPPASLSPGCRWAAGRRASQHAPSTGDTAHGLVTGPAGPSSSSPSAGAVGPVPAAPGRARAGQRNRNRAPRPAGSAPPTPGTGPGSAAASISPLAHTLTASGSRARRAGTSRQPTTMHPGQLHRQPPTALARRAARAPRRRNPGCCPRLLSSGVRAGHTSAMIVNCTTIAAVISLYGVPRRSYPSTRSPPAPPERTAAETGRPRS
jgi:hypothetical protein